MFVRFLIREQDPLKQGLKLIRPISSLQLDYIREQDPLKQGLKQMSIQTMKRSFLNSRARSIKTRIETHYAYLQVK